MSKPWRAESTFRSDISGKLFPIAQRVKGELIRDEIIELIRKEFPNFNESQQISIDELYQYRQKYLTEIMKDERGQLEEETRTVLASIGSEETISDKMENVEEPLTLGQRLADRVADFGGSWTFILSFMGFLVVWIALNVIWLRNSAFDPFPFILLNLILSCIAALQAPVIMMSQNRQEEKDRERSKKDYMINLKSELEIRNLNEKVDHLIFHQIQEILEEQRRLRELLESKEDQTKGIAGNT
jgi:uncharacterized membrane protein